MGQAKSRGSQADRIAQAVARVEAMKPASIMCNHCKAEIKDIHVVDSRNMDGIKAAFVGMCECGHSTFALHGAPDAVAKAMIALEESMEGGGTFGRADTGKSAS
jgi:hypothetical protein